MTGTEPSRARQYVTLHPRARPITEIEIKRSRFIGYACKAASEEQARSFLAEVRQEHREARHVCHAFVIGPDRDIQRSSDDGEPSGTAGAPILAAITNRQTSEGVCELSDVVVAVVRYFGGIKLGAGGLVQAYSDSAATTLDAARLVRRVRMQQLSVAMPIAEAGRIETTLRAQGVHVEPTSYAADHALLAIAVPDDPDELQAASDRLAALSAGRAATTRGALTWVDEG